jgi:NAD(P)-dependent dehydrogenase (short-subunit alcohol dehydrogenase family)
MNAFDATMAVNLRGTVDVVRQAMPHLCRARPQPPDGERGVIVMISSVAALEPQVGLTAYAASKGAIATLALCLARDLAEHSVRVVAVAPGVFATPMVNGHPQQQVEALIQTAEFPKRAGQPDEFARLVGHIVENSMLNGTLIRLDAGLRMPSKI